MRRIPGGLARIRQVFAVRPLKTVLTTLIALFAVALAAYLAQRRLIYFPARQDLVRCEREAQRLGLEPWQQAGRFLGWRAAPNKARKATGTVLVLHGNAGAAIHRTYFRNLFQAPALEVNFDVYLLEYPGYGPRSGHPSEPSLLDAAAEAIALLGGNTPRPLLLVGESLGAVVAAMAGAGQPTGVQGMLLITPFANLPAVARRHYPFLPDWFLRDQFRADLMLPRFSGPVAFLIAGQDSVAPPELGKTLFDQYSGRKRLWVERYADHNGLDYHPLNPIWKEILRFLESP